MCECLPMIPRAGVATAREWMTKQRDLLLTLTGASLKRDKARLDERLK